MHETSHIQGRILSRVVIADMGHTTPCWNSDRSRQPNGYTKIGVNGETRLTHRVAYEEWCGAIPEGMVIDHLCRNRQCCNPEHLEPVTTRENLVRGDTMIARQVAKTHCVNGHEFTPENTYHRPDRPVGRMCRTCRSSNRSEGGRRGRLYQSNG